MLPVTALNGNPIGLGKVGDVFTRILNQWSANTGLDVKSQIQRWDAERGDVAGASAPTPYRFKSK
jgi:hypothetical protein